MPAYKILLTRTAEAAYLRLRLRETRTFERVRLVLDSLSRDPFQGKPLKGSLAGKYSYRLGVYRIIYSVVRKELVVYVLDIGHRRDIYK